MGHGGKLVIKDPCYLPLFSSKTYLKFFREPFKLKYIYIYLFIIILIYLFANQIVSKIDHVSTSKKVAGTCKLGAFCATFLRQASTVWNEVSDLSTSPLLLVR